MYKFPENDEQFVKETISMVKPTLEPKHLSAYLPYKLKVIFVFNETTCELKVVDVFRRTCSVLNQTLWEDLDFGALTPILRPLSSMTIDENKEMLSCCKNEISNSVHSAIVSSVEQTEYLLSKHFDVFGLLEKGLAVPMNSQGVSDK